jgi:outer membrane lipopolysaccharide assembly protein LptE/RlpB
VLSKLNEERRLRDAMERDVAQDILDRLRIADAGS